MAGFTLIEVLVAIAIFASLSVGAYQVLNQVQRSNEISAERTARLAELQRAMVIMDADFRQMALRQFRTDGEAPSEQILQWKESLLDSDQHGLLFVRLGWHNPQQQFPRGEVAKVGYRLLKPLRAGLVALSRYSSGAARADLSVVNWGGRLGSTVLFAR